MKLRHNSKQVSAGMRGSLADSNGPTLNLPITKEAKGTAASQSTSF